MPRTDLTPWLLSGILLFTSGGCGTIFSPNSQTVTIQTEPQDVDLYLDGRRIGQTPVELEVDRDTFGLKMVMLKKEGYETKQFHLKKTINSVSILNFTLLTPWTTDAASGNMIEYSPRHYYIELKPQRPLARREARALLVKRFVLMNYDNVLVGISEGGGEYIAALMQMLEVPPGQRQPFVKALQQDLPHLLERPSPFDAIHAIQRQARELSSQTTRPLGHS